LCEGEKSGLKRDSLYCCIAIIKQRKTFYMSYGISIHIGLNQIDALHYGSSFTLKGCINDANAMHSIAKNKGFNESYLLIDKDGTHKKIVTHLKKAASKLIKGDFLFITYAGHGASVYDTNGDEPDEKDETWCLYDRMILDDELTVCWAKFKAGVKIFMISDSCHSGSISRTMNSDGKLVDDTPNEGERGIKTGEEIFERKKTTYEATVPKNKIAAQGKNIKATVILLSGCQDNQTSRDGIANGLFTEKLLQVYNNGTFKGNYANLRTKILQLMPANQTPNFSIIGKRNVEFEKSVVFEK
jgi:metacaspase-1